ncbi:MAG: YkgJ family cysteine cluster protein [Desulfobulbaceae bacterium]
MSDGREIVPEGRTKIGRDPFRFHCHPGVSCFTNCCRKLELYLYPYDIIRLKNRLNMRADEFLHAHTRLSQGAHPFFPAVMLNMRDDSEGTCPFLGEKGCSVYRDRPSACRTYPLERGVEKEAGRSSLRVHYFLTHHDYCKGHNEEHAYTVAQWERDQQLYDYNLMNDAWAEVDAFFATNPWHGEGAAGPRQQLAFMVCYNIDAFREYAVRHNLLRAFRIDRDRRRRIEKDDGELLRFGFDWLRFVLGGHPTLQPR